jgi:pimeloyl-ACP methyl ester carboxylesterase
VVTFDPRGNGRSDRPRDVRSYDRHQYAQDAVAVLDAAGVERAAVVSWCGGSEELMLAAEHPERVTSLVAIAPNLLLTEDPEQQAGYSFDDVPDTEEGWAKSNRHYWQRDWRGYLEFFYSQLCTEPHSTKQIEDGVGWGLETDPETILLGLEAEWRNDREQALELCARVRCPTLVIQGTADEIVGPERGGAVAAAIPGARLVTLQGCGHGLHARDPVKVNQLIRDFLHPPRPANWTRGRARPQRAVYISSPIGLGHARRDIAIADELRALRPGLQIEWLAQHPVTALLEARGDRIHPLSAQLANESRHMQRESRGHELHCFQALRRMDEILLANYMVFHDLVRAEPFDLWIGDEAWELDYYLHENPGEKRAPFAWLTDFVGYLPMPEGGRREADLTADYNAEMIEQIARYPHVRDRAIFVGEADDIVPDRFGPGLPLIRDWTVEHFSFSGYITGFPPAAIHDRAELRRQLGYREDERVCLVSVGGSGVGSDLLQRVIAAYPEARRRVDGLRMVVVAGPRIDSASLPAPPGVEVHGYVDDLHRHLAHDAPDILLAHVATGSTERGRLPMALARATMTDEQRKSVALEYLKAFDNGGVTSTGGSILELFAEDAQVYFPKWGIANGVEEIGRCFGEVGSLLKSIRHDYANFNWIFSGSDTLVAEGTSYGEHRDGPWRAGMPDWGAGRWCDVFEIRDWKIQRCFIYLDPDYASQDTGRYPWLAATVPVSESVG